MGHWKKAFEPKKVNVQEILGKSLWKERSTQSWAFYCPHCRSPRKIPYRPQPGGWKHFSQIGLTAGFVTLLTWKWFDWKGIVVFLPIWAVFEFFYRSQVRAALSCPNCGFDPILYMVDTQKARDEIEKYWRKKFEEKGIPFPEPNEQAALASTSKKKSSSEIVP